MSENEEKLSVALTEPEQVSVPIETTASPIVVTSEESPICQEVALVPENQIVLTEQPTPPQTQLARAPAAAPVNRNASDEDNFDNLQKAVSILSRAKTLDDGKSYAEALKLYREGVDILLEELIVRQGTDQSRTYLRAKCNDFMNRIDQIKLIIQIEKAEAAVADKENSQKQVA
jgi:uncharacterized protein YheU (UPF0270 family)